jgi:hypothetical protein
VKKRKYRRIRLGDVQCVIDLRVSGHSMPSISLLTAISVANIHKILHTYNPPDNRIFLSHNLVKHLRSKYGISLKEYVDLLRTSNILAPHGISPAEALSQIRQLTEFCYKKNIELPTLITSMSGFSKFIYNIPHNSREELRQKLMSKTKTWEALRGSIDTEFRKCEELRRQNDILRWQILMKKNPGVSSNRKDESKPDSSQIKTSVDERKIRELFEYCKDWPDCPEMEYFIFNR